MASMSVTTEMLRPGEVDEAAYEAFVTKIIKSNMRSRDKANKRGNGIWFGKTDAECVEAAGAYCRMYRHQFRVLVKFA